MNACLNRGRRAGFTPGICFASKHAEQTAGASPTRIAFGGGPAARASSADTSVSIHLLTNDTGCTWRHLYDPATGAQEPFRSGYANVACEGETAPPHEH